MKKLILLVVFACIFSFANAQKQMVVSAYNYTKSGQLDKALASIDKALASADTKDWAKTWWYRGNIYFDIYQSKDQKYKSLDSNALAKAYDSYIKALELDTKKEFNEDIMNELFFCGQEFYNIGVENYNKQQFSEASVSFDKAAKAKTYLGIVDSAAIYNSAFCAGLAKRSDLAKDKYIELIKMNYNQPLIYSSLANIYLTEKDTASAISTIQKGRAAYPENIEIAICEVNIYLVQKKNTEAKEIMEMLIKKDAANPALYFNIGVIYDGYANDEKQSNDARSNFFNESVNAYKKAIELKPDYFDAIYNLGALYFNEGIRIFQEADKLTDMDKYAEMQKQFEKMWADALPYLEKALELNGTDYNTLLSLKQLYSRTNQLDKLKVINEKLDGMNKK